jgi:uncharacterized damage-inducible protein DinB
MSQKQILLEQIAACHDTNGWFVAMKGALAGLDAGAAARSTDALSHSVWQILYHVAYWNERSLKRLQGVPLEPGPKDNDESFGPASAGGDAGWRSLQDRYDRVMADLARAVEQATDEKLASPIGPGTQETFSTHLANLVLHTAHHIGQIVTLRKLHGSWDPKQGVS